MNVRIASGPARPDARSIVTVLTMVTVLTSLIAIAMGSTAFAQAPPAQPKPPAQRPPAAAPAPKGAAQPKPSAPAESQAPPAEAQVPKLIYSPWTKFCLKGQEANAQLVCFTGKDGRVESGMPVVSAVLIEPENDARKILRVTLPLGMLLPRGTRAIIDQDPPMTAPFFICFINGCMADYDASAELIGKMKKGQGLAVQARNSDDQVITLVLPLADFGKAYDGPATDPKVFEEQQKKLQDDLQKRAEEARKKLESPQPPATR